MWVRRAKGKKGRWKEREPTPKPPGFEALLAIAGLLAVGYMMWRRKR